MQSSDELKARQRAVWTAGDYPDIAATIEDVSDVVADQADVRAGEAVLDVATGHGNAALAAARRGGRVTGIDITPGLLDIARRRAREEGLEIVFEEADAEALPFPDDSFDKVLSVFGAMFAPDQERAAGELLRVGRPGATIVVTAWTPDGLNGRMLEVLARHLPAPPEGFRPATLWGDEARVRELFSGASDVHCERRRAPNGVRGSSTQAWLDYLERVLGPIVVAKRVLEPQGRWWPARAGLVELYDAFNEADDGSLLAQPEYLLTTIR